MLKAMKTLNNDGEILAKANEILMKKESL